MPERGVEDIRGLPRESTALQNLIAPRAIALIGASATTAGIRGALLNVLQVNGFSGRLYPVNPNYQEVHGLRCYPSVSAIGAPVDLAVLAIPADRVMDALEDCAASGVGAAIVISSGFAEEGEGRFALQAAMSDLSRRTGLRILGPNCQGVFNAVTRVAPTFSPTLDPKSDVGPPSASARRVAVVAQSGGLGFGLYSRGRAIGLSFSHVITTGNECDITLSDMVEELADDPDTSIILLYTETIRSQARFRLAAAKAAEAGKPIVCMKVGRSQASVRAARAHTASDVGSAESYDALFRELGVLQARHPDEAVAIVAALATNPVALGPRVGIVTVAGGAGVLLSDALTAVGLELPLLSARTQDEIKPLMPSYGSAQNPVDVTAGGGSSGGLLKAMELMVAGDEVDIIVLAQSLAREGQITLDVEGFRKLTALGRKPILLYAYTPPSEFSRRTLAEAGTIAITHLGDLAVAAAALVSAGRPSRARM